MLRRSARIAFPLPINIPLDRIEHFCSRWHISEFALFGSVLRHDFGPDSDVDVLVTFEPGIRHGIFDIIQMEEELKELFGHDVDLLTRRGVEMSDNAARRDEILTNAEVVYARR
jgi:predicted nucleotidyltransferase